MEQEKPVACSDCFSDSGLKMDAMKLGIEDGSVCTICGSTVGHKLPAAGLESLAYRFFVWGSLFKSDYGAAPLIQFNEHQKTCIKVSSWLKKDLELFERILGVGFFHYGPRLWMLGEVEPLKALQKKKTHMPIIERIQKEYPERQLKSNFTFFRIRKEPKEASNPLEYDSPPLIMSGAGRLDSKSLSILYASPDLQVCIHECRVTAEDNLYVATLVPQNTLKLLDLTALLNENDVTEFESMDIAIHMLFLAGQHSYEISRNIATAAFNAGFDGIAYPSYFSLQRMGIMPFQTIYGISKRRITQFQESEQDKAVPNIAIFGHPISDGKITVKCINKLILSGVEYHFHFGPVEY